MLMENIMNGNYWFIPLSLLMTVLSCMSYFYFAYKDYEDDSEQIRYVTMSARLIIGCLALVVVSLLYAVLPLVLTAAVSLPQPTMQIVMAATNANAIFFFIILLLSCKQKELMNFRS